MGGRKGKSRVRHREGVFWLSSAVLNCSLQTLVFAPKIIMEKMIVTKLPQVKGMLFDL